MMSKKKYLLVIITWLLSGFYCFAQDSVSDVNSYLHNEVYKNIAAYQIRNAAFTFNHIPYDSLSWANADLFYRFFLADFGYKLDMTISQVDSIYPRAGFFVFKVYKSGFTFKNDLGLPNIGSLGPISGDTYLVALNEKNGEIKFISGQFFKTRIASDFLVDLHHPESMIKYLEFRTYDIGGTEIVFRKKRHKEFIFKGWSKKFNQPIIISVNRKDTDIVSVKRI